MQDSPRADTQLLAKGISRKLKKPATGRHCARLRLFLRTRLSLEKLAGFECACFRTAAERALPPRIRCSFGHRRPMMRWRAHLILSRFLANGALWSLPHVTHHYLVALQSGGPGEQKARLAKVPRNLETNVARGTRAAGADEAPAHRPPCPHSISTASAAASMHAGLFVYAAH